MIKQYNTKAYMVRLEITKELDTNQDRFVSMLFYTICSFLDMSKSLLILATCLFSNTLAQLTYIIDKLREINNETIDEVKHKQLENLANYAESISQEMDSEDDEDEQSDN